VWSTWSPEAAVNQSPLAMHEMKRANLGGAIARYCAQMHCHSREPCRVTKKQ